MTISIPPIEVQREMRTKNAFDSRNLVDRFKGMDDETINSILRSESSELVLMLSNKIRDINHYSAIRSANAFNVNHVVMTGRRNADRRGSCGSHNYTDIRYIENILEAFDLYRKNGYTIVAAEYDESRIQYNLMDYNWDEKSVLVMGEESRGLEPDILDAADHTVYVRQSGAVRSMNLASAATVFIYDYEMKSRRKYVR